MTCDRVTTTCPEHIIKAIRNHELYMKFTDRKLGRSQARLWKPVRRGVVLEQCVLSASPEWRVIAERIIRPLRAQSSFRVLCHSVTQSILPQLDPTALEHDIYCICGRCGTKRSGVRHWIAFSIEILQGWPTFFYVAIGAFLPRRQCNAGAKARRQEQKKGRVVVVPCSSGVAIVPDPTHVDSWAEYVPPRDVSGVEGSTQRTQPPRAAKLHRRIVVDAEDSADPDPESDAGSCSGSGSDGSSGSGSGRSSGSGSGSGSSSGSDATSSAITVSGSDVEAAAAPPPAKKKFLWTGVRPSQCATRAPPPPAIDVDAESSCAPVPHLLSEGDFFPTDTEAALKQEGKEHR